MWRGKMVLLKGIGMAKRGKIAKRKTPSRRNKQKEVRQATGSRFLAGAPKTSAKKVGRAKQFQFNSERYVTNISRKNFASEEFKKELLGKAKKFRKKYNSTKTRTIAEIRIRRNGKTKSQFISIGRAEFGDVNQRIEDTMKHLLRLIRGYANQGWRVTRVSGVSLQRVTRAPKKKKRRKK
jgi:hypothetical protein